MSWPADWSARTDWSNRSSEFGALARRDTFVTMEFGKPGASSAIVAERTWELWRKVTAHPNILVAVDVGVLRYAALDWKHGPIDLDRDAGAITRFATWGNVLARAYEHLSRAVSRANLAWFACPLVKFDLEGGLRIAFVSPKTAELRDTLPPEILDRWPLCDERTQVHIVGHALACLAIPSRAVTPIAPVLRQCLAKEPSDRLATLGDLSNALRVVGGRPVARAEYRQPRGAWELVEKGLGFLAIGDARQAASRFERALRIEPTSTAAHACLDVAAQRIERPAALTAAGEITTREPVPVAGRPSPSPLAAIPWSEAALVGGERERELDFAGALSVYRSASREDANLATLDASIARCQLRLGDFRAAVANARRAIATQPDRVDALGLAVNALLPLRRHAEALQHAETWLAHAPDDAKAHYARGKCLFGLGRLVEARDEFERALAIDPKLLEAMLLRRELDRAMLAVRGAVGSARAMTIELPPHLLELRDVLLAGQPDDAIRVLEEPRYERDPVAQLLLVAQLSLRGDLDRALAVCDRAVDLDASQRHAALLAKADTFLELDRAGEALVIFASVEAERPDLSEALAGRARALLALGRGDEAESAMDKYVAVTGRRSELRVRASRA